MTVIFRTIHGSRLYGFANEQSDEDWFVVTDSNRGPTQSVVDGVDTVTVGLNAFLNNAANGSHQSVEALFSPFKQWESRQDELEPMLNRFHVGGGAVFAKYERTIKSFCFGAFKKRRHAARLRMNLYDLRHKGWFNPRLDELDIDYCNKIAGDYRDESLFKLLIG